MCKEGWCVGLGQEGVAWGWEELSELPKQRLEQKKGEGKQRF